MHCANGGIVITDNVTKLLDWLKLESFRPHQEIAIQCIIQDQKHTVICTYIDYHNQHERAALIGLFHATSSVLTSVESYRNYRKPTQREVQGYLSSLQRRVSEYFLHAFRHELSPMVGHYFSGIPTLL